MVSKNSEARECANTNRASIEKTCEGVIDMNIIAKQDLKFHGISLQPISGMPETWLTATQIGYALQYADDKAVQRIYSRHADEFTEQMTGVVKVTTPYGEQMTRAFSLRGAHLISMFARTPVAKEFRRWVLNILDREVAINMSSTNEPTQRERHAYNISALDIHYQAMYDMWINQIEPALRAIESPLAGRMHERFKDSSVFMTFVKRDADRQLLPGEKARIR